MLTVAFHHRASACMCKVILCERTQPQDASVIRKYEMEMDLRLVDAAVVEDEQNAGKLLPRLLRLQVQANDTLVT